MPIQVSFSTDNLTPEEARWIASLVQPAEVDLSQIEPLFKPHFEHVGERLREVLDSVASEEAVSNAGDLSVEGIVIANPAPRDAYIEGGSLPTPAADSTGLQWDERIHASSKALNADGTWRTKRGVDKALVASVEVELRGAEVTGQVVSVEVSEPDSAGRVEAVMVVAPPPPAPRAEGSPIAQGQAISGNEGNPEVFIPAPPAPTNAPAAATSPFVALMKRVTTAQSAGKLTQPRVKQMLESMEKKSIMDLRTDEDAQAAFGLLLDGEGV